MALKKSTAKPIFLTLRQVADMFQVKEKTVRGWLQKRLLRGSKIGKAWRIRQEAVEEFSKE